MTLDGLNFKVWVKGIALHGNLWNFVIWGQKFKGGVVLSEITICGNSKPNLTSHHWNYYLLKFPTYPNLPPVKLLYAEIPNLS